MDELSGQLTAAQKRQRATSKRTLETMDGVLRSLRAAKAALQAGNADQAKSELQRAKVNDSLSSVREDHKLYYATLSKFGKTLDKELDADIDALCPPGLFNVEGAWVRSTNIS